MAVLDIVQYPDERLKSECTPIDAFTPELVELAEHLTETAEAGPSAVGIAAPQVGELVRMCLVDGTKARRECKNHGRLILVNPEITSWKGLVSGREGCLSIPDYTGNVVRAEEITLEAYNLEGKKMKYTMTGFEARIAQHEIDHLDGVLFLDRLMSRRKDLFERK